MKKIIIAILIIIIIILSFLAVFISRYGKDILVQQIEKNLQLKVSLESASFSLPLGLNIKKLKVGDLLVAEEISFSVNPLGLLAGKIILDGLTITEPVITLEQSEQGRLNLPALSQKKSKSNILPTGIVIRNGKFIFIDRKIDPAGFKTIIDKINFYLVKANLIPMSLRANYSLSGVFTDTHSKVLGDLKGKGWLDFGAKDMDGNLEIKDLNVAYFEPYYGDFISEKKLLAAVLNLKADLKSKNNDLSALCHFLLSNLIYQEAPQITKEKQTIFSDPLDLFIDAQGRIALDFTLRTEFDNPRFNVSKFKSVISKAAGKTLSKQPGKIIERVGNTFEQFRKIFQKTVK